jgi:hypothetical protein
MVHNTIDFDNQCTNNSLQNSDTKSSTTEQFVNTKLFNKTPKIPLMAQPFEMIYITDGTKDGTKSPDKPNS